VDAHKFQSNRVTVYDLIDQVYFDTNVGDLVIFSGTEEEAFAAAMQDKNQHLVQSILGYRGSPLKRSSMEIYVQFVSGDKQWLLLREINNSLAWDEFCKGKMYLHILVFQSNTIPALRAKINKVGVEAALINTKFFLNLRAFGAATYAGLIKLPDRFITDYWVIAKIAKYEREGSTRSVVVDVDLLDVHFIADGFFIYLHGAVTELPKGQKPITKSQVVSFGLRPMPVPEKE
jgi:hypothetical protein